MHFQLVYIKKKQIKQPPRASAKLNWFYDGYILFIWVLLRRQLS